MEEKKRRVRRIYSTELKQDAVRLVIEQGMTVVQVARDLDIGEASLYEWTRLARIENTVVPQNEDAEAELKRLRKRIKILEEERDILKKASAFYPTRGYRGSRRK